MNARGHGPFAQVEPPGGIVVQTLVPKLERRLSLGHLGEMRNELGDAPILALDQRLGGPIELVVRKSFELGEVGLEFFDHHLFRSNELYSGLFVRPETAPSRYERSESKRKSKCLIGAQQRPTVRM